MAEHKCTYCPEDNKLRFYPDWSDPEFDKEDLKAAGYRWASKQGIYVCPRWTLRAEDAALEYVDDIVDEDYSPQEHAADNTANRIEATLTGNSRTGQFEYSALPCVRLPDGVDEYDSQYDAQVVWLDDVAYYVVSDSIGQIGLTRQILGCDYGDNVHRTRTAPASTAGVAADKRGLPIRSARGLIEYWVED